MQAALCARFAIVPFLLMGLQACATTNKIAACLVPVAATHTVPVYPPISQRLGEYGTTVLAVGIGSDGEPAQVRIDHSSGSRRLDVAAVTYILEFYRWQPPPAGCTPADTQVAMIVAWRLDPVSDTADNLFILPMSDADYPSGAAAAAEEGDTLVELTVLAQGAVMVGRVTKSSGYPDLDDKALAILKARPGLLTGKPIGVHVAVVRWMLRAPQRQDREFLEIHARRLDLQAFSQPVPIRAQ